MVLNGMVLAANKLVRVMITDHVDGSARSDSLFSSFAAQEYFDVDHVVLDHCLGVKVLGSVKHNVTWLHLLFRQLNWHGIKLVALIAGSQSKAKLLSQIIDSSPNEGAAIQKQRRLSQRVVWLSVALSVGDPQVLLALPDELLSEPVLEFLRSVTFFIERLPFDRQGFL